MLYFNVCILLLDLINNLLPVFKQTVNLNTFTVICNGCFKWRPSYVFTVINVCPFYGFGIKSEFDCVLNDESVWLDSWSGDIE